MKIDSSWHADITEIGGEETEKEAKDGEEDRDFRVGGWKKERQIEELIKRFEACFKD